MVQCTYFKGGHYDGEVKDNKRWGQGSYVWKKDSGTFTGRWDNDEPHQGLMAKCSYFPYGFYDGEVDYNKRHGKGIFNWITGERYSGQWVKDERCGEGEYKTKDGVYEGEWEEDKKSGHGIMRF